MLQFIKTTKIMRNFNIYPKLLLWFAFMTMGFSSAFGQLHLKLQLIDDNTWGVYVKPQGITPTTSTITGSAQVTLVMPKNFAWSNLVSVSGQWTNNATVNGPSENLNKSYVSFGLVQDLPKIVYKAGEETLLFKIDRTDPCPDSIYLIDCNTPGITDPFCPDKVDATPGVNSFNSNPGNEFSVIDFGKVPPAFYGFTGIYAPSAWSCHDCDGDGILNGLEDTNGNGTFDPGIDSSALCDPCDPIHVESATLELISSADTICAGDALDTAFLVVDIVGGWRPYTVVITDGTTQTTVNNYESGDLIPVIPSASKIYDIVTVVDSFGCAIDPDSINGGIPLVVEGPLSFTDQPDNVTQCHGFPTSFTVIAANAGAGTISYQWQVSTNNGTTWTDITNGTPYSTATTPTLNISNVAGLHGRCYRMKITSRFCNPVYSNMACLSVEGPINVAVSGNPANTTVCAGSNASFTGGGTNSGAVGTLSYLWQVNSGTGWANLTNGGVYSGVSTTTVSLTNVTVGMDNYQYRMKIFTGTCSDTVFTNAATLNIEGPLTFTTQPANVSNCAGNEVFFSYKYTNVGGGPVTFQWQQSLNGGGTWTNLSNGTVFNNTNGTSLGTIGDTLAITNVIGLDGSMYRVAIKTSSCTNVFSNAATLSVNGNVAFSDHPDDITVCSGNDTTFTATASIPQGTFTWGWQISTDNGASWQDIVFPHANFSHSSTGAVSSGSDVLTVTNLAGLYNARFRAVATSSQCDPVYSLEARLSVEGPLSVTTHPAGDNVVCSGDGTFFTSVIDNPGVPGSTIYRWQIKPAGTSTWSNLVNNTTYNGTSTATLSISNVAGLHGNCYRLSARTSTCNIIFTNEICLTVEGPITITQANQPDDITVCSGETAAFTSIADVGTAGTLSYQWQVSSDNGLNWNAVSDGAVYSGSTTTTLNILNTTGLYGRNYRLRFTTGDCEAVFSNKAVLTVEGPISISDQPDNVTQCYGEPVLFAVGITDGAPVGQNDNIFYQWQVSSNNGSTWSNVYDGDVYNGIGTDTMSISKTNGLDNNRYRVKIWTATCDTLTSTSALLQVEGPVTFVSQPSNATSCSGSGATFQATTANPGLGTVLYKWQRSCNNGASWADITDGGVNGITGSSTTVLNIADVAGLYACNRYRLKAWTATCDSIYSNYAQLTVEGPISIATQPQSVVECSGNGASFSVTTANTGSGQISYQWQFSIDNGGTWFNLSNNSVYNGTLSANLSISDVAGLNGRCYRVLIQTVTCSSVASNQACLTVEGPISFSDHPDNVTQCSAESVTFTGTAGIQPGNSGTIIYQWQTSMDGINWSDVADGSPAGYVGSTTNSLTVTNVTGLNGRRYRLTAKTGECSQFNSNPATLTVEGPLSIGVNGNPVNVTTCDDKEVIFAAKILNPGQGAIQYQWQQSTNNGVTWTNLANATVGPNIYNGAKSDTLSIAPVTGLNNTLYRVRAWTATCDTLTTSFATLSVEGPITFTDQPDDVTLCSNGATSFTVAIDNATGIGTVQYQWEVSSNGVTWTDIPNAAPYSGGTTNTLAISNVSGLYNRKYRCKVKTGNCDWEFSQLATLFVEGPITINVQPADASVCSNVGHIINTTVTNPGAGVMQMQWQVSTNGGTTWTNLVNGGTTVTGSSGKYQGVKTEDLAISLVRGMNGYQFRLLINTSTCSAISNVMTLTVLDACSTAACDNDLDGIANNLDPDDDNDLLSDFWEQWMTTNNIQIATDTFVGTGPWNYHVNPADMGSPLISYDKCSTDSDGDGILDGLEDPDGDNISNAEETDGDGVFDGNPLDPCSPILGPTCIGVNLAIKAYLQGALIGIPSTDTLMRDNLRSYGANSQRLIPTTEPYTGISNTSANGQVTSYPFKHTGDGGGEVVADSTVVFSVTGKDAIVDWVFVELRSSTALDSVITTRAGLIQRDGDVVDLDGHSSLRFLDAPAGPYYVALRHRNHLGVMSAEALDLSPIMTVVDFTDTTFLTNGIHAQVKLKLKDKYVSALWAGDLNSDGRTIYQGPANDVHKLFTTVLGDSGNSTFIANYISQGYLRADIDLNGKAIYQGPGNDRAILLFQTTLTFPQNEDVLANYIIFEQLP
jgi:hypothetical protein